MHKIFPFVFFLLIIVNVKAQNSTNTSTVVDTSFAIDEEGITNAENKNGFAKDVLGDTTISFNDFFVQRDTISALKLEKEYNWTSYIDSFLLAQKKGDSQSKIVIKQNNGSSFLNNLFNSGILQVIMWVVVAGLVLFIIYKLFLSEGVFGRRSVKVGIDLQTEEEEDISLVKDYNVLLKKAYDEGNWRFAMRFLFLKTLQKLNEKTMIKYAVDKTNSVYVAELPDAKRNDFASLSLYYEYVWYGNVEIDKAVFDAIENKFNNFLNKI